MLPFLFLTDTTAIIVSGVLAGLALFTVGAAITLVTGRGVIRSGLRQLAFGLAAAGITFGIGSLFGAAISCGTAILTARRETP